MISASSSLPSAWRPQVLVCALVLLISTLFAQTSQAQTTTVRINAGGPAYTDSAGHMWSADADYTGGGTVDWSQPSTEALTTSSISGTSDPTLYLTERYGATQYAFSVPNGTYQVNLHFAENYVSSTWPNGGIGFRVFSVQANGVTIVSNLDVMATVGAHAALVETATVAVTNGQLVLTGSATAGSWFVDAIEVIGLGGGSVSVPYVVGDTQAAAATSITSVGLVVGAVTTASSSTVAAGNVISESPTAGTSVSSGSSVNLVVSSGAATTTTAVARINAGGPAYTDSSGNVWSADEDYTGGNTLNYSSAEGLTSSSISGTSNGTLFLTERYSATQYAIPVPNGTYQVNLYFAENWFNATSANGGIGDRVFSVQANGVTIVSNLDIFATVGAHAALVETATVTVTNGQLVLTGSASANNWVVDAIEVISLGGGSVTVPNVVGDTQAAAGTAITTAGLVVGATTTASSSTVAAGNVISQNPTAGISVASGSSVNLVVSSGSTGTTATTVRINAGGPAYTDSAGNVWNADEDYTGGSTANWSSAEGLTSASISGTSDGTLFLTEHYSATQYAIPVPNGTYQVNLYFAENWFNATSANGGIGDRVFSVQANGVPIVSNLDIFATVGAHAALVETATVTVTNGQLVLTGSATANNWVVDAIEVIGLGGSVSVPYVVGDTQAAGTWAIMDAGLLVGTVTSTTSSTVAAGHVISESPTAGTSAASGSSVNLVVSTGPVGGLSVPYVVGDTQSAAGTAITGAGLVVGTVTTASNGTVPAGNVISENPTAGTSVASGSSVNLVVSTGPAGVSVPYVVGDTQAAAGTAITSAGLVVGTVTTASSNSVSAGNVISENPTAGTSVAAGSSVTLLVSSGSATNESVPYVVGDSQAAAGTAITGAQLVVGSTTFVSSNSVAAGNVISESPTAGTSVAAGSSVSLVVSTGPANTSGQNWAWMNGSSDWSCDTYGQPGARYMAMSFTDNSGDLWLFGGGGCGFLNDLWKFNIYSQVWTWVGGSAGNAPYGNYGQQGVASYSNSPGGRAGSASWTDTSGNFWLFGGNVWGNGTAEFSFIGDLWEYQPSTNEWTWVSGPPGTYGVGNSDTAVAGVYGTPGVPGGGPGARFQATSWTDYSGNLWLFGGVGYDGSGTYSTLNDLWKFTPGAQQGTGTWTWVSGSSSGNQTGNYVNEGSAGGTPGARQGASSWVDAYGNLWMFGGYGPDYGPYNVQGNGDYSDLWMFTPSTGQWTWVSGPTYGDSPGVYGTPGVTGGIPAPRNAAAHWTDGSGNFWLMGGQEYIIPVFAGQNESNKQILNDLWEYNPNARQWTWMAGSSGANASGNYGSQGSAAPGNTPGARAYTTYWSLGGALWLFGGDGYDCCGNLALLNDLWQY